MKDMENPPLTSSFIFLLVVDFHYYSFILLISLLHSLSFHIKQKLIHSLFSIRTNRRLVRVVFILLKRVNVTIFFIRFFIRLLTYHSYSFIGEGVTTLKNRIIRYK